MTYKHPSSDILKSMLEDTAKIALIGASSDPSRPANRIMKALMNVGYKVYPVNPNEDIVHGEKCFGSLQDIPEQIDMVNVFRRPAATPEVARQAVEAKARFLWLQLGVYNEEAYRIASNAGLTVVMDKCIAVEHAKLL